MIEVKNLCYDIGDKIILKNVNLTLQEGSVMGLVGINGAGKTTLLRLISGVLTGKQGEILIDGQNVGEEEVRRALFFLPDDPYFTIYTTGESLYKMYKVFYPSIDRAVFDRFLKEFALDPKKPIRNFSKGMRRQLYISLALAVGPKYLLLDEAFLKAVMTGDRSLIRSDYADALKTHKLCMAANASMESGQVIYF